MDILPPNCKIICVGLNYHDHAIETKKDIPTFPILFARYNTSIIFNEQNIILSKYSDKFDFEAELAVVIGKKAFDIKQENAFDYIYGYTIFNDVTARDFQNKSSQWLLGKNFDNSASIGPRVIQVDKNKIIAGLSIQTKLNNQVMQQSNTNQMIFKIPELIETISQVITLQPGDVISTGTPAGVGYTRAPRVYLQHNDVIEIEIENIGILKNKCIRA
jgi:acylpyruvate hydrolase